MSVPIPEHSPLPWRSVYPLGSKQRCAAVESSDHYVYLYVAESDATENTVRMHQANADLIANAQERIAALEEQVQTLQKALKFYADRDNHEMDGGKRARAALAATEDKA